MKGRGWRSEMKDEKEEKVSKPRTAGETAKDEERGDDPWGASSPTSIMEGVCVCEEHTFPTSTVRKHKWSSPCQTQ